MSADGQGGRTREASSAATSLRRLLGPVLIVTMSLAAVAVGTVHEWSRGVVFGLSALAFLLALGQRLLSRKPFPVTVPFVALAVAVAATALQLIPLPAEAIAWLSPAAHELLSLRDTTVHPLSLEPAATVSELAKLGAYLAFFAAATIYASRAHQRRHLVLAVAATATLVAIIGIAQAALGVKEILGVYKPHAEWAPLVRGTFVNPNHFGALMCLGAPCAMLIALRERRLRPYAFAATFIIDVAVILTVQRASVFAALLGNVLVFGLDRLQQRRGREAMQSRAMVRGMLALAIVAAAAVAIGFGGSHLQPEATRTIELQDLRDPLSKLRVWARSAELVWTYPWTGIGRGAFPQVFTRVSEVGGFTLYEWAENLYVQVVVDWGVPVAILLALLAGWAGFLAVRQLREDPLGLGAFAGLFALAVHEAADFAVELPGVALPALALLACLFGRRSASSSSSSEPAARQPVGPRLAFLALPLALYAPFFLELRMPSAKNDAAALTVASRDPKMPIATLLAVGDAARRRHPADYYLCALVAERLVRDLRPEAMSWLNEAMFLNPTHPAPHLMAAELLASTGRKSQALVEYRLAAKSAPEPRTMVWDRVLARYPSLEDLLAATPDEVDYLALLAKWLQAKRRPTDAERVYEIVVEREPTHARALTSLAGFAIARRDAGTAHRRVEALRAIDQGPETLRLEIEERVLAGDLRRAIALLDDGNQPPRVRFDLDLEVSEALARAGRTDEARTRLDQLLTWDLYPDARIRLFEARATVEALAGNKQQHRWELEQRDRLRHD